MRFWEFYRIILHRRWMILGITAVTLIAIYLSTKDDKPHYRASAQIMPSEMALYGFLLPSPGSAAERAFGGGQTENQLANLMSLVKSKRVAERTIQTAGLKEHPEDLMRRIDVSTAENPGARSHGELGTDIIRISVRDLDPDKAVTTVNALAHVFANFYQEISHQEHEESRDFLQDELAGAEQEMNDAAERLRSYKRTHKVTTATETSSASAQTLDRARAERDAARATLAEAQAKYSEVVSQLRGMSSTRTVVEGSDDTQMVQQLENQLAQLTVQLNEMKSRYEDAHPKVETIRDSIDEVNEQLKIERGKMRNNTSVVRNPVYEDLLQTRAKLAYERDGAAARAGQAESAYNRAAAAFNPETDVTLQRLENAFQTAQTTYNNLKDRYDRARISAHETTSTGAIRVIDQASEAEGPVGANKKLYMVLGAMLSLVLGAGLALTMESLDNRIRTNVDVEQLLGLPVTTLIPSALGPGAGSRLARIAYTDPLSPIAESYRFLRTDVLLSTQLHGEKAIMVATAKPGQGGTQTVSNLGISLAMDGKRVILVDADMRRPTLHRIFKLSNDAGLSNALSNELDFEEVVVSTEMDNLLVIPAGPMPSNPSELLGSGRMRGLVHWLTEHADYVLFDTPSAIAFTDAVVLSRVVDGVILVVRAQQVPRGAELQVRKLLNKANANIIGVVLNDVHPGSVDSCYYHAHYYPESGKSGPTALGAIWTRSLPPKDERE